MVGADVVALLQNLAAMIPATGDAPDTRAQPAAVSSRISSVSEPNGKRSRSVTPRPRGGDSNEVDRLKEELRGYERRVDELERSRHLAENMAHHVVGRHRETDGQLAMSAATNVRLREEAQQVAHETDRVLTQGSELLSEGQGMASAFAQTRAALEHSEEHIAHLRQQGAAEIAASAQGVRGAESAANQVYQEARREIQQWQSRYMASDRKSVV